MRAADIKEHEKGYKKGCTQNWKKGCKSVQPKKTQFD